MEQLRIDLGEFLQGVIKLVENAHGLASGLLFRGRLEQEFSDMAWSDTLGEVIVGAVPGSGLASTGSLAAGAKALDDRSANRGAGWAGQKPEQRQLSLAQRQGGLAMKGVNLRHIYGQDK